MLCWTQCPSTSRTWAAASGSASSGQTATAKYGFEQWVTAIGAIGDPGYHTMLAGYLKVLVKMGYLISDHEQATMDGKEYVPSA
jgi:hypothetical protein